MRGPGLRMTGVTLRRLPCRAVLTCSSYPSRVVTLVTEATSVENGNAVNAVAMIALEDPFMRVDDVTAVDGPECALRNAR